MEDTKEKLDEKRKPFINLRQLLFLALGAIFGIFLICGIRFRRILPACFLLPAILLVLALFPLSKRRSLTVLILFTFGAGLGAAAFSLYDFAFTPNLDPGTYVMTGTVYSVAQKDGYSIVYLKHLSTDGKNCRGNCSVIIRSEEILPGDILRIEGSIEPLDTENFFDDAYLRQSYANNIRYSASASAFEKEGRSYNPFLFVNAKLHETLVSSMDSEEANVAYALLTGNSASLDEGLLDCVRRGGIAHIFAVSGLHIGILFGAVLFLCRPLGKYRVIPAIALSLFYCAMCNFTVSSIRALIMCSVSSVLLTFGEKYDFLDALSLSAVLILLFSPAQWYTAGFRLSFGACLGLALLREPFARLFQRCKIPEFLANYLSANLSVEIALFPIQMDCFGYFPVLGIVLNALIVPILPVLFLGLLILSVIALFLPFGATFFLALPEGALSLFLFLLSEADFGLILSGFSLGMGSVVFLIGLVLLCPRIRMRPLLRSVAATLLCTLFVLTVVSENVVFSGFRVESCATESGNAVLFTTPKERILIFDEEISFSDCNEILMRRTNSLDLVVTLGDGLDAINKAAFLPTKEILAPRKLETGLQSENILFLREYDCGNVKIRYVTEDKVLLFCEGKVIEIDFDGKPSLKADLFLGKGAKSERYLCRNSEIRKKS